MNLFPSTCIFIRKLIAHYVQCKQILFCKSAIEFTTVEMFMPDWAQREYQKWREKNE